MSKLIPAEELATQCELDLVGMVYDPANGEELIVDLRHRGLVKHFEECHRNAAQHWLERAAKTVCQLCYEGLSAKRYGNNHWEHRVDTAPVYCDASEIRDLIPENPAPAVEHRRGGIVIERGKTPSGNDVTYMTRENPAPAGPEPKGGGE